MEYKYDEGSYLESLKHKTSEELIKMMSGELEQYDIKKTIRKLEKIKPLGDNIKNTDNDNVLVYRFSNTDQDTFINLRLIDLCSDLIYQSGSLSDSNELTEGPFELFEKIEIVINKKVVDTLDFITLKHMKLLMKEQVETYDSGLLESLNFDRTGKTFYKNVLRPVNLNFGLLTPDKYSSWFNIMINLKEVQDLELRFTLNKTETSYLGGSDLTYFELRSPYILYTELQDEVNSKMLKTLWDTFKTKIFKINQVVEFNTDTLLSGTKTLNYLTPVLRGEQVKKVKLSVFSLTDHTGNLRNKMEQVQSGSFGKLEVRDGVNGKLMITDDKIDTSDKHFKYYLKKDKLNHKVNKSSWTPEYLDNSLVLDLETGFTEQLNTSYIMENDTIQIKGEVVGTDGNGLSSNWIGVISVYREKEFRFEDGTFKELSL